mgnify:CR=1 FL=1
MELSKIELITNEIQQERNLLESVLDTIKIFLTNFEAFSIQNLSFPLEKQY